MSSLQIFRSIGGKHERSERREKRNWCSWRVKRRDVSHTHTHTHARGSNGKSIPHSDHWTRVWKKCQRSAMEKFWVSIKWEAAFLLIRGLETLIEENKNVQISHLKWNQRGESLIDTDRRCHFGWICTRERKNEWHHRKKVNKMRKKNKQGKQGRSGGENRIAETAHAGKHIYKKFE